MAFPSGFSGFVPQANTAQMYAASKAKGGGPTNEPKKPRQNKRHQCVRKHLKDRRVTKSIIPTLIFLPILYMPFWCPDHYYFPWGLIATSVYSFFFGLLMAIIWDKKKPQ